MGVGGDLGRCPFLPQASLYLRSLSLQRPSQVPDAASLPTNPSSPGGSGEATHSICLSSGSP